MKTPLFQVRVGKEQRERWIKVAGDQAENASAWAREGLDVWATVCSKARELKLEPRELVERALEVHGRHRAAVELVLASDLPAAVKQRLLRVLSPGDAG